MALLSSASLSSCDTFQGSLVAMTITWPFYPPACVGGVMNTPPGCQVVPQPALLPAAGQRLELWGVFASEAVPRRLAADVGTSGDASFTGFSIVPAIDPNDPCLIRGLDLDDQDCTSGALDGSICGAPIFSKQAHTGPGLSDNDAILAQQQLVLQGKKTTSVTTVFSAVDAMTTGSAFGPLLTLVQWNPDYANDPRKTLPAVSPTSVVTPSVCANYRDMHPYFYVGNPHQVTKALAGVSFGFLAFATGPGSTTPALPPQNFNGMSFTLAGPVDDIQQIIFTLDARPFTGMPLAFDKNVLVQLFLAQRLPDSVGGRGAIRMVILANSTPPLAPGPLPQPTFLPMSAVGTVSILSSLNTGLD